MAVTTRLASALAALGVGATLAGCGQAADPGRGSEPGYQIGRVDRVTDDFPAGFAVDAHPAKTLDQQDIDGSGITAFTGAAVDPPQCRSAVIPPYADPVVGTAAAGVHAEGDRGNIYVVALRSPAARPADQSPSGCDRVALSGSSEATGTAERIAAPEIGGVTTTGVKMNVGDPQGEPDYVYTAALDDRTSIVVMGSADAQLDPQRLMSDLLVKATAAVSGR